MTSVLRSGARRLLAQAVEMEVTAFIAAHGDLEDDAGRRRVVRHGHHRERQVQTGIGPVAVRCPKLCQSAAKKWRRLDGSHRLAEIVEGVKFKDGEKLIERAA